METESVSKQDIRTEMEESYLDYAMSVIVARALPDVRDGLKPVHRRILFAMREMGLTHSAKTRKSAAVVGDVLGKYHPHGDMAVYDSMVRMAQSFSLRYPLVEGQGNFGDIDGDSAAAMRYTEVRLTLAAEVLLADIEKSTVAFVPNYDATRQEPKVLPALIPNLLLNGSEGIAVGMATAIPPHNLGEVMDALILLSDKHSASSEELSALVKGPDFPTGGIIYGAKDISRAYAQGAGPIVVRGKAEVVAGNRGHSIIISEIPYQVRKAALVTQIADLVRAKRLDGIKDVRDESGKEGVRVVIELRADASPQRVLNTLFKLTDLQKTYHMNLLALVDGIQPRVLSLKEILEEYLKHRREIIKKRSEYDLKKAQERSHILEGLQKALSKIDAVIKLIKMSRSKEDAHQKLRARFKLSDAQAASILALPLSSLARLEREKILAELGEQKKKIKELQDILSSPKRLTGVMVEEFKDIKTRFSDERRTDLVKTPLGEIADEDLIPEEQTVIVLTSEGYVKRIAPTAFHVQRRGGKGVVGVGLSGDENVEHFTAANTHDTVLFFTSRGRVFKIPAYEIPEASRSSRGRSIVNFIAMGQKERVAALVAIPKTKRGSGMIVLVTRNGLIKRMDSSMLANIRRNGLNAITIKADDSLDWAVLTGGEDDILLATKRGTALRFSEKDLRAMGRQAAGVKAVRLRSGDNVVGVAVASKTSQQEEVIVITEGGFGKKVKLGQYRRQKRGGVGVKTLSVTPKTGSVVGIAMVNLQAEELIAVSSRGKTLKVRLSEVSLLGRSAQGTRIMRLDPKDKLVSFSLL